MESSIEGSGNHTKVLLTHPRLHRVLERGDSESFLPLSSMSRGSYHPHSRITQQWSLLGPRS